MQRDPERVSLHGGKTNPDARVCDRVSGKGGVQWEYIARSAVRRTRPYGFDHADMIKEFGCVTTTRRTALHGCVSQVAGHEQSGRQS